ncbi:MAG: hypothetical protein JWQ57_1547 [Mucilaginibacter sp.]|nr:hypothetical protein [Mucilaginibacter sp.]
MSNLILTIMHGYDYPFVEPFFKSLKAIKYTGELIIFTSDQVSHATKKKIKKNGAIIIDYSSKYPFIEKYESAFKNISPAVTINNYRFILYLQFLMENGEKYKNVMLTDIRDVIFQKDPFDIDPNGRIFFFLEDAGQTFHHKFNYQWLTAATDANTADTLIDKTVSCAGITIGSKNLIIDYLKYINTKLNFIQKLEWGLDQGIHNSYIYIANPGNLRIFNNDEPFVSTLGAYQPYEVNSNGEVVNSKGEIYAVVHQYDRSGKLFASVKLKYIGSRLMQKLKRVYFLLMP